MNSKVEGPSVGALLKVVMTTSGQEAFAASKTIIGDSDEDESGAFLGGRQAEPELQSWSKGHYH